MARRLPTIQLMVLAAACLWASCDGAIVQEDTPCPTGQQKLADGRCQPPGLPLDMPCLPGEAPLEDGSCQPAGVPPSKCGEGFEADGEGGCRPILPDAPCPDGLMATPGETECREVAPCGSGPWGDIPIEADTQFVDGAYPGNDGDGSQAKPWKTIKEGIDAAAKGAVVAVAAGVYHEDIGLSFKPRRLWGRCPSMVSIEGVAPDGWAVGMFVSGAEIHGVAITGPGVGLLAQNTDAATIEDVYVHDTGRRGVLVANGALTVRGSLIERAAGIGLDAEGGHLTLERSVVRDVTPGLEDLGLAVAGIPLMGKRSTLTVRDSLVFGVTRHGVHAEGTDVLIERTAVRGGDPVGLDPAMERSGVFLMQGSAATVRQTVSDRTHFPFAILGTDATLEQVTATHSRSLPPGSPLQTAGIAIERDVNGPLSIPNVVVRESAALHHPEYGLLVLGSSVVLESVLVRDGGSAEGHHGAIDIQHSTASILHSAFVESAHLGVAMEGAQVTIDSSLVRDVRETVHAGDCVTVGKLIGPDPFNGPSSCTIRASLIEGCVEAGVAVTESALVMESSVVRDVRPRADGLFGDGVVVVLSPEGGERSTILGSRVEEIDRAGVSAFGGGVDIGFSAVSCATFDLAGEELGGAPFRFEKVGDNLCGCPDPEDLCKVDSPGLAPPEAH